MEITLENQVNLLSEVQKSKLKRAKKFSKIRIRNKIEYAKQA